LVYGRKRSLPWDDARKERIMNKKSGKEGRKVEKRPLGEINLCFLQQTIEPQRKKET